MITIFTTPKPFIGHTTIHQLNALKSWKTLHPEIEIIVFGKQDGIENVCKELNVIHILEVKTSEYGTPLVSSMFELAEKHGRYRIQVYANCDIIFFDDLIQSIKQIPFKKFLMIGQRYNLNIDYNLNTDKSDWQQQLLESWEQKGTMGGPLGADYFLYSAGIWSGLAPFIIGRAGYDNYLIYHCRLLGIPVIDATQAIHAIHQNHDYNHRQGGEKEVWEGPEAKINLTLMSIFDHSFSIIDADWILTEQGLRRNYCRGDILRYMEILAIIDKRKYGFLKNVVYFLRVPERILKRISKIYHRYRKQHKC